MSVKIDLGDDHVLTFTSWSPDRELNPQYAGMPDVERYGCMISHKKIDGSECWSGLRFQGEVQDKLEPGHPAWKVESWEPLTLSPSILCLAEGCGDHGFVRDGKWVKA